MPSRRKFLNATFSGCTGFAVGSALTSLSSRLVVGDERAKPDGLVPTKDETTGLPLLRLPEGFRYLSYGWTKDSMHDGTPTPSTHDGMGIVNADGDIVTIVRNHELSSDGKAIPSATVKPWDDNAQACLLYTSPSPRD